MYGKMLAMEINEFIDTCSDDMLLLEEAKQMLEAQDPELTVLTALRTASFCRMSMILMVSSTEHILKDWQNENNAHILQHYFSSKKEISNDERIHNLCEAFLQAGSPVDPEVFNDYLAIKYLRNILIHTDWKENQKAYIQERGFPLDTRKLTEEHWHKMRHVHQKLMLYIAASRM